MTTKTNSRESSRTRRRHHVLRAVVVGIAAAATAAGAVSPVTAADPKKTPPASTAPPAIAGPAEVGGTLTASAGTWRGTQPISYAYQWRRCDASTCADVPGATGASYSVAAADAARTLRVRVTASNRIAAVSAESAPIGAVTAPPPTPTPTPTSGAFFVSPTGSDSNPGTIDAPWRTVAKAMATLTAGQIAYLRAGTYAEGLTGSCSNAYNALNWTRSGAEGAPITISGYPGEEDEAVIKAVVNLRGNYLRLTDLVVDKNLSASNFDGNACTGSVNIAVWGDYDDLVELEVRNSNMSGIYLENADYVRVLRNHLHHNGRHSNLDHGLYYKTGVGGLVANNVVEANYAMGMNLAPGPVGTLVAQNTVVGNGTGGKGSGIIVAGDTSRVATGIRLVNNIAAFNYEFGIRTYWASGVGSGNVAVRNLLYGNGLGASWYPKGGMTEAESILADPAFVDRLSGNFHLLPWSRAIGAARIDESFAPDYDGLGRDAAPDLGSLEYR